MALLLISFFFFSIIDTEPKSLPSDNNIIPKSYPFLGSFFAVLENQTRLSPRVTCILQHSPSATIAMKFSPGFVNVITANPANVQHILKTHFYNYPKGIICRSNLFDFLGNGIFDVDAGKWLLQRKTSSHEFNTKSLSKFVETVVETEFSDHGIEKKNMGGG